jgi:phage shock protein PspC (stress-responsive transcriptional regulator)
MKKSIKINLGGMVIHVDDDAYELLRSYLDQVQARFRQVPGESEILNDIETRMAELFQEKLVPGKEVINLEDAREVIAVMGKPEEIGEAGEEESEPYVAPPYRFRGRRIYRDPSNQRIAGVCSGLAAYFRVDPLLVRILFVVFTLIYGAGILVYLVLWIGIPEARTAAEKLEMYGEPINVENIERQVRSEYGYDPESGDAFRHPPERRHGTVIGRVLSAFGRLVLVFFKIIGFIIAFSLIVAGIAILGAIIGLAVTGRAWFIHSDWGINNLGISDAVGFFVSPTVASVMVIGLILLVAIPVIGLIYGVVKAIFRFKVRDRVGAISLTGIWVITFIVLLILGATEGVRYSAEGRDTSVNELTLPRDGRIVIETDPVSDQYQNNVTVFDSHSRFWIARSGDSVSLQIRPTVRIEYSMDSVARIRIRKTARGVNYMEARRFAESTPYHTTFQDSILYLDPVLQLNRHDRFHAQEIDVTIELPAGTRIYLDKDLKYMLYAVENTEDTWSADLAGKEWVMTRDGLAARSNN